MPNIPTAKKFRDVITEFDKDSGVVAAIKAGDCAVHSYCETHFDGVHEGQSYADMPKPLNLTFRGANVMVAHLAANAPKHAVKARRVELRGEALLHSLRLDILNADLNRVDISRRSLLNTLLRGRTVTRVGLRAGGELVKLYGHTYDPGNPFLKIVPNRKHRYDVTAPCRQQMRWESESYMVPRSRVLDAGLFNRKLVEKIQLVQDMPTTEEQRDGQLLGSAGRVDASYIEDMIELMDVVFYDADGDWTLATMAADPNDVEDYLSVQTIEAVDQGMFIWEEFYPSPKDEIGSVSWGSQTMVQTLMASRLMNKIVDEAENCKRLILAQLGVTDAEIAAVESAKDMDILRVNDPQAWTQLLLGGIIPDVANLLGMVEQWWNVQAGQIDELSGAGKGGKTATQSSSDSANANTIMSHLKQVHLECEEARSRALAHHIMNDPRPPMTMAVRISGGEMVQLPYSPLEMRGSVNAFEFKIRPKSMPAQDPNVVLRRLIEFLSLPFTAAVANPQAAARIFGDQSGIDDMDELVPDPVQQFEMNNALNTVQGLPPSPPPGMGAAPGGMGGGAGGAAPMARPIDGVRSAMSNRVPV